MIVIKYSKTPRSQYISHIDLLRQITRLIRRSNIDMNFSQGFNPHMLLKMSAPCPLGILSKAEYLTLDCKEEDIYDIKAKLINNSQDLINITDIWKVEKNPNFAGKVVSSEYFVETDKINEIFEILKQENISISYKSKKKIKEINAQDYIYDYYQVDNGIVFKLGLGNKTLRIDRLVNYFNENFNTDIDISKIIRIKQFFLINSKEVSFDDYLK